MQVKNRQHCDGIYRFDEIHTIGKVSKEGTADLAFHSRELPRIVIDTLEQEIKFVQKSHTQAGSLVFVPYSSSLDVEVGLGLDDEPPAIRRINAPATYVQSPTGPPSRADRLRDSPGMPQGVLE